MKIICAPDSFKESVSAVDAAAAMARGAKRAVPDAMVDRCPVGDGGEGTLAALMESIGGRRLGTRVAGPLGDDVEAGFGVFDDEGFSYVESAGAIGLGLVAREERDIMRSTTFGVGQLILRAAEENPRRIVVGIGGSATNDGGCGLAQALGVRFYDHAGELIGQPLAGGQLGSIARIDVSCRSTALNDIDLVVAGDVWNPLTGDDGAARVYGPQKGANESAVDELDQGLRHLAALIRRDLHVDVESVRGAGAAGGLGAGLIAFAGATIVSGIETVLHAVNFDERVSGADLCLTGEGRLDAQSMSGKACAGVARIASLHDVPTVALVGSVGPGADDCLDAGLSDYVVIGEGLSENESRQRAAVLLEEAAGGVALEFS